MNKITNGNKIIFLIGPPRSLSTAFLRMMGGHDDIKIINEPACGVFNKIHYPHSQGIYTEHALNSYYEVNKKIQSAAKDNPIFIKEMSFSFEDFIQYEPDLIKNPNVFFTFLLRDPHHCIISYYKKMSPQVLDYVISDFDELTGFRALYNSFKLIQNNAVHKPYIIRAEQLYNNANRTVRAFCKHLKLPFKNEILNWNNLGEGFTGFNEWQETKKLQFTHHWHHEAICSRGFHQPTVYEVDEHFKPTFSEIKNKAHQKKCMEVYQESKTYYDLIL